MNPDGPFIPACPTCAYDLTGLPDGPCPECGSKFTLAALEYAWRNPPAPAFSVPPGTLFVASLLISLLPPTESRRWGRTDPSYEPLVSLMVWMLIVVWLVWQRKQFRKHPRRLLWLLLPTARSIWALFTVSSDANKAVAVAGTLIGCAAIGVAFYRAPRLSAWTLGAIAAIALGFLGFAMFNEAQNGWAAGRTWSTWADPRTGQIHDQYPLRNDELQALATGSLAASMLLAGLLFWKRGWMFGRKGLT